MDSNVDMVEIYQKLDYFKTLFDPSKETYIIIDNIVKGKYTEEQILEELQKIKDTYGKILPSNIADYYEILFSEVKALVDTKKIIKEHEEEINRLATQIEKNLNDRGIEISKENLNNEIISKLKEQENHLDGLKKEEELLKEIEESLTKEKEVGSSFGEKLDNQSQTFNTNLIKVNEEAEKNIKHITNPTEEELNSYMNYYKENQRENTNFCIKIGKGENAQQDERVVELFYKGNEVSEKDPRIIITFTDVKTFEQGAMADILTEYAIENTTQTETKENNNYTNISTTGNSLEMENMDSETINASQKYIEEIENSHVEGQDLSNAEVRKNKHVNVRVRVNTDETAKADLFVMFILLLGVVSLTFLIMALILK